MILVTHDVALAAQADRMVHLHDGKLSLPGGAGAGGR
jgi:predicted ABC-type transport system involved in lysophospholipase L1 biosynthesis ATPase subunit